MVKLAIIIVNYKTPKLTIGCLESLRNDLEDDRIRVVVVDNNSGDSSVEDIEAWLKVQKCEGIRLISSESNNGFSSGNNIGMLSVEAEYYLLLNSDAYVRPGAIRKLMEAAAKEKRVGIVSPRLEWPDSHPQESCFRFHSPFSEMSKAAKTSLVTNLLQRYIVAQPVKEQPDYYDWTSFACVLIKKQVLDDVGLMDEKFFMYFEDVDFCYRAKKAGWLILNQPDSHVVHLRGGSSPVKERAKLRKRLPRYFYESRTLLFFKCYGRSGLFAANVLWSLGFLISKFRALLSSTYETNIAERQWQDIWINFLNPFKPYIHPENYDKA